MDVSFDKVGRALRSVTKQIKDQATEFINNDTPLEKNLKEATSNTNWGCSTTVLAEISRASFDYNDYFLIMKCIWDGISAKPKYWRKVIKSLNLLEFLIRNGTEKTVDDTRDALYRLRSLADFHYTEDGRDRGGGVRDKVKQIIEVVSDTELLRSEREKARAVRDRYIGIGAGGERTGAGYTYGTDFGYERNNRGYRDERRAPPNSWSVSNASSSRPHTLGDGGFNFNGMEGRGRGPTPLEAAATKEVDKDIKLERERAEKSREKAKKERERQKQKTEMEQQNERNSSGSKSKDLKKSRGSGVGHSSKKRDPSKSESSDDDSQLSEPPSSFSSHRHPSTDRPHSHKQSRHRPTKGRHKQLDNDFFTTDAGWDPPAPSIPSNDLFSNGLLSTSAAGFANSNQNINSMMQLPPPQSFPPQQPMFPFSQTSPFAAPASGSVIPDFFAHQQPRSVGGTAAGVTSDFQRLNSGGAVGMGQQQNLVRQGSLGLGHAGPVIGQGGPAMGQGGPVMGQGGPVVGQGGPVVEQFGRMGSGGGAQTGQAVSNGTVNEAANQMFGFQQNNSGKINPAQALMAEALRGLSQMGANTNTSPKIGPQGVVDNNPFGQIGPTTHMGQIGLGQSGMGHVGMGQMGTPGGGVGSMSCGYGGPVGTGVQMKQQLNFNNQAGANRQMRELPNNLFDLSLG